MFKNISKLVYVSPLFISSIKKQCIRNFKIQILYCFAPSFTSQKVKRNKNMRLTSLNRGWENCKVDLYGKIVYSVISPTYIKKEIEKLILCVYCVIMHLGNVGRILEKRSSAMPRVYTLLSYSPNISPVHYHKTHATRFLYFLKNENVPLKKVNLYA